MAGKGEHEGKVVEFQAVIMAGGVGNRLYPLTTEVSPKPLLPICNRPLLYYQLQYLERAGFHEAIVVTKPFMFDRVSKYVKEIYKGALKCNVQAVDGYGGTADALRKIRGLLHHDFIVISGDLVTDVFPHYLADIHRSRDATATILLQDQSATSLARAQEEKKKKKSEEVDIRLQFIGLDRETSRIWYFRSAADLDDRLRIYKTLLRKQPHLTVHTRSEDAHLYIFSRWVLEVLDGEERISSIQGELIPYLVNLQVNPKDEWLEAARRNVTQRRALRMSHSHVSVIEDPVSVYAYVCDEHSYVARANTSRRYLQMNTHVLSMPMSDTTPWESFDKLNHAAAVSEEAKTSKKSVNVNASLIGQDWSTGKKVSIKKSVIGSHCKIGDNVKISNSVIMDHVTIFDKCSIQNTIIGSNATIHENCTLVDAQVGFSHDVPKKSTIKSEAVAQNRDVDHLVAGDGFGKQMK